MQMISYDEIYSVVFDAMEQSGKEEITSFANEIKTFEADKCIKSKNLIKYIKEDAVIVDSKNHPKRCSEIMRLKKQENGFCVTFGYENPEEKRFHYSKQLTILFDGNKKFGSIKYRLGKNANEEYAFLINKNNVVKGFKKVKKDTTVKEK